MELRHFRYFVAVAEELHFGRAAARLHISQPPLSQQIQALEAELEVTLFSRSGHRVRLTEAGTQFLKHARLVLAQAQTARTAAQRADRGETGELQIGFTGSLPFTAIMPRILHDYRAAYPEVTLQLREETTHEQIERLADGRMDIGFFRPTQHPSLAELETHVLLREPLRVALHAQHPLARRKKLRLEMLAGEPFIIYARSISTGLHDFILSLCHRAGFTPRIVQQVHEMPTVIGLVAAGMGVALVASSMETIVRPDVVFRPLAEADARSEILLAWRREAAAPALHHFIHVARQAKAG